MTVRYEQPKAPRFVSETIDGREQITIGASRNVFVALFLTVWLGGWTAGGIAAMTTLLTKTFQPFLVFWLCGWLLGEIFVALSLCWMFFGAEILRTVGHDLEVGYRILGFTRRRLFRGSEIRGLSSWDQPAYGRYNQMQLPFFGSNKTGSVKFNYGARTIHLGAGLDEAEGRLIVDRLRKRLPSSATGSA
jgi:hypothetical protein